MENDVLYIGRLIVDPAFQNRGIATSVLKQIEKLYSDAVKSYTLFTGHLSKKNLHLYKMPQDGVQLTDCVKTATEDSFRTQAATHSDRYSPFQMVIREILLIVR